MAGTRGHLAALRGAGRRWKPFGGDDSVPSQDKAQTICHRRAANFDFTDHGGVFPGKIIRKSLISDLEIRLFYVKYISFTIV